jgi:membrane fusion protein, macrolide-specific efflux system
MRRELAVLIGAAAFAALGAIAWAVHKPALPPPLTAIAHVGHIDDTVLASGTIAPVKLVSVGAQASGRVLALHVALGDEVRKGQLIAEIDPSTERNALATAEASLEQIQAQRDSRAFTLRQAELAFKRAHLTYAREASSQADYETAEATYRGAEKDVAALEAQIRGAVVSVDTARVNLGFTKVTAPIDGTVVAIVTPEGQTVNAVQAAPTIVKLADLSTMTVKAQISEADVTRVHAGQAVYFTTLGNPDHRYQATLRAVEPAPESLATEISTSGGGGGAGASTQSAAIYYNGLFDIPNPDRTLRPSMTAEVHIVLKEADSALLIPSSALGNTRPDGRRSVKVLDDQGRQEEREVHVGIDNHIDAQVLSGLAVGTQVIFEGGSPK